MDLQTLKFVQELGINTGLKAAVVLGGDNMDNQFSSIYGNPDIIIDAVCYSYEFDYILCKFKYSIMIESYVMRYFHLTFLQPKHRLFIWKMKCFTERKNLLIEIDEFKRYETCTIISWYKSINIYWLQILS